jgi:hypothetical protein
MWPERRVDGQVGTTILAVFIRNSAKAPKNSYLDASADLLVSVKPKIKP